MFEHLNQSQRSEFVKWSGQDKIEEITSKEACFHLAWACGVFFYFSLANPRTHLVQITTCDFLSAPHLFPPVQVELFDNHEVLNAHYMGCTFKHRSILEPARISNFLRQSDNLLSVLNFYQYWTIFFFQTLWKRWGGDVRSFPKNHPSLGQEASLNM